MGDQAQEKSRMPFSIDFEGLTADVFYFEGTEFSYFDQCSMISCAMGTPTR